MKYIEEKKVIKVSEPNRIKDFIFKKHQKSNQPEPIESSLIRILNSPTLLINVFILYVDVFKILIKSLRKILVWTPT
jgi:hypothetical protein